MRKRLLLAGLALLPVVVMALVIDDFVREVIVIPLLYLFWIARLLFKSIPQLVLWAGFIIVALIMAGKSLSKRKPLLKPRSMEVEQYGRVEDWARLIDRRDQGDYSKWRLAHRLGVLALETLAYQEELSMKQTRRHLESGKLDVPPQVWAFLRAGMTSYNPFTMPKRRFQLGARATPLDLDPEQAIQFLEDVLNRQRGEEQHGQ